MKQIRFQPNVAHINPLLLNIATLIDCSFLRKSNTHICTFKLHILNIYIVLLFGFVAASQDCNGDHYCYLLIYRINEICVKIADIIHQS